MKLKTLKEIEFDIKNEYQESFLDKKTLKYLSEEGKKVNSGVLKQEAIKWIKELKKGESLCEITFGICDVMKIYHKQYPINNKHPNWENEYLIEWIKHFFNIEEKDLK